MGASPDSCGAPPSTVHPLECCQGINRFVKQDALKACSCSKSDYCCQGHCLSKAHGILKDGKFDQRTALKTVNKVFAGDVQWIEVKFMF